MPEAASLVPYLTMIFVAGVIGCAAGLGDHRPFSIGYLMLMLTVLLAFVSVDIVRPRRGLTQVSRDTLSTLQATTEAGREPCGRRRPDRRRARLTGGKRRPVPAGRPLR